MIEDKFTDPRDGKTYRTVRLIDKIWMAENLNFDVGEGCWFYDNDPSYETTYGRLYTWEAAKEACPPGWSLPRYSELWELRNYFGGTYGSYNALIDGGSSGFNLLLGGWRDPNGDYDGLEKAGSYWSGTEKDTQIAGNYGLSIYRMVGVDGHRDKSFGLSGRCIREIDHFSYWDLP